MRWLLHVMCTVGPVYVLIMLRLSAYKSISGCTVITLVVHAVDAISVIPKINICIVLLLEVFLRVGV